MCESITICQFAVYLTLAFRKKLKNIISKFESTFSSLKINEFKEEIEYNESDSQGDKYCWLWASVSFFSAKNILYINLVIKNLDYDVTKLVMPLIVLYINHKNALLADFKKLKWQK